MNVKTTILAIIGFVGIYSLGYPLLYSLLAFNAVFWIGIIYDSATFNKDKIRAEILAQIQAQEPDPMQVAFERFLVKKFVESTSAENEACNQEINLPQQRPIAVIEV